MVRRDEDKRKMMVWGHHWAAGWDLHCREPSDSACQCTMTAELLKWRPRHTGFCDGHIPSASEFQKRLRVAGTPNLLSTSTSNLVGGSESLRSYSRESYKPYSVCTCVCVCTCTRMCRHSDVKMVGRHCTSFEWTPPILEPYISPAAPFAFPYLLGDDIFRMLAIYHARLQVSYLYYHV